MSIAAGTCLRRRCSLPAQLGEDFDTRARPDTGRPGVQHGTYSFFFYDADDNAWEILANPPGGYSWMFERGDQQGVGHMSRGFERPASTVRKRPKDT